MLGPSTHDIMTEQLFDKCTCRWNESLFYLLAVGSFLNSSSTFANEIYDDVKNTGRNFRLRNFERPNFKAVSFSSDNFLSRPDVDLRSRQAEEAFVRPVAAERSPQPQSRQRGRRLLLGLRRQRLLRARRGLALVRPDRSFAGRELDFPDPRPADVERGREL